MASAMAPRVAAALAQVEAVTVTSTVEPPEEKLAERVHATTSKATGGVSEGTISLPAKETAEAITKVRERKMVLMDIIIEFRWIN